MRIVRALLLAAIVGGLLPAAAWAQSTCPASGIPTPQFPSGGNVFGRSAAQWNAYFGALVVSLNGCLNAPLIINPTFSGTLNLGTTVVGPVNGGTGVNNGSSTITIGGNLQTGGALSIGNMTVTNDILIVSGSGIVSQSSGIPNGITQGTSTNTTSTGTVAAPTQSAVHWNPVSPAASVSFNLTSTPADNYCQTYYNESNQNTYAMILLGNGHNFTPSGDTSIGEFGTGRVRVCYSSSTGEWSQS